MECTNKYYDCITHLRLGRGAQEIQNKASNGDFWFAMSRQIGRPRRQATPVTLREATSYFC